MNTQLAKAKAALAYKKASFPVLVLDGNAQVDPDGFRATLYGADFKPVSPETTDMTQALVKSGQHFMHRMRTRAEWDAESLKA